MRIHTFAQRNAREILRDPLTLVFGIGFPLAILFLLSAIQAKVPVDIFVIDSLAPGISVFGLSFITLFSATVISKDRSGAFLQRLYTTPMTAADFILGYTLPIIPIATAQCAICYIAAFLLGLQPSINVLYAIALIVPVSVLYIAIGLLCGSILTEKQTGAVCGALLANLSAWLSGIWFDLELVGGTFKKIAYSLPFVHAVDMERAVLNNDMAAALPHLLWVAAYAIALLALAIVVFLRKMKNS